MNEDTDADRLIGTWRLHAFRIVYEGGDVEFPLGEDADGLIVYTAAGFMSGVLTRRGRRRFSGVRSSVAETGVGQADEIVEAFNGYFSYFCRYELDLAQRKVTHRVIGALLPDWEGRTLERFWRFGPVADRPGLTLVSAPLVINGRAAHNELQFVREPDRTPAAGGAR